MAILARKSGWMIACQVLEATKTFSRVKMMDSGCVEKVKHSNTESKVFDGEFTIEEVEAWIMEGNE